MPKEKVNRTPDYKLRVRIRGEIDAAGRSHLEGVRVCRGQRANLLPALEGADAIFPGDAGADAESVHPH